MRPLDTTAIRGIIFDLDGTLYRMEVFFQPLMFFSMLPRPLRLLRLLSERSKLAGTDFGNGEKLMETLCSNLSATLHISPEATRSWIESRFYPAFIAAMRFQRRGRPGLVPMLARLRTQGIKLAVLSDYDTVEERLRMLRIPPDCFDHLSSCEAAGALKPAARPFLEIARKWSISAEAILVVGDRDDTDGQAARSAGMQFLQIVDGRTTATRQNALTWQALRTLLLTH
jgi:FMN phosphatase YigB (HAD superfamily)